MLQLKKIIIVCTLLSVLLTTGCASFPTNTKEGYIVAGTADMASTALALSKEGLQEGNPLGVGGALVSKVVLYTVAESYLDQCERENLYHTASYVQYGATANNILLFLGAASGVAILTGILTSLLIKNNSEVQLCSTSQNP